MMCNMYNSISFCTTCRNRLWQLKETLPYNIEALQQNQNICLVDFGSTDGLSEWVWTNYQNEICMGKLVFFEVKSESVWHMAKAKNIAHRISKNDYLFSLDADNFISKNDINIIAKYASINTCTHQFSGDWNDGSCGRIGVPRNLFYDIGGYDESLLPMGAEDLDFKKRIISDNQYAFIEIGAPEIKPVFNSDVQRISEVVINKIPNLDDWNKMNITNTNYSDIRIDIIGSKRLNNFSTFYGLLNGKETLLHGLFHEKYSLD